MINHVHVQKVDSHWCKIYLLFTSLDRSVLGKTVPRSWVINQLDLLKNNNEAKDELGDFPKRYRARGQREENLDRTKNQSGCRIRYHALWGKDNMHLLLAEIFSVEKPSFQEDEDQIAFKANVHLFCAKGKLLRAN